MADYVVCNKNNIDAGLLFSRLWSEVTTGGVKYSVLRIKDYSASGPTTGKIIDCQNEAQAEDLFKQALELAADGQPVLRVFIGIHPNGVNLTPIPSCDIQAGVSTFSRNAFVQLVGGEVCMYIANVV